jgi:hypothetical protein
MNNGLYIGDAEIELPKGSFLYICDEPPPHPKARLFDPTKGHSFDPLKGITKKGARDLAKALYANAPEGASTLTVRNGRRALARALSNGRRLDELEVHSQLKGVKEEVEEMIDELLFTDVARSCLCSDRDFAFHGKNRKVFARLNRVELGDDDALAIGLFLLARYKGQIVIEDGGFYLRDMHASLLREERLIARVNTLAELPPKLRQTVLLIKDKMASGATYEDAELLAKYAGLRPDPTRDGCDYNVFVREAMG